MSEIIEPDNRTGVEIAIIGMAGRFPGAKNINEFWENLKNGIESVSFFSDEELNMSVLNPDLAKTPDFVRSNGGVLEDKELFDAPFFDYTPREAEIMNPQMRILHECTWEALEDAGYDSYSYDGLIGIYAGASSSSDWEGFAFLSGKSGEIGGFGAALLTDKDFLSTRIAYKLNLRGPALAVQTACSTSLVAVHMACQAVLDGECDIALAGGVKVSAHTNVGYYYQEGMTRSPDGHCRAFDARAKGTTGGDGAGIVALKALAEAAAHRDHIYAVIKGTAINNDGIIKAGFTAPSREGQTDVIRVALRVAEVEPKSISYIEAHGTGTPIGDPIEIEALKQAFDLNKKGVCAVGSVKTNIGHLDAAAGITGLIKTVLALKYKSIPPSLHYEESNPKIDFENSPFYINSTLSQWKSNEGPLRAGISSFGIGGTNAHAILEEAPAASESVNQWVSESVGQYVSDSVGQLGNGQGTVGRGGSLCPPTETGSREYQLILLSAKTESALGRMTQNLVEYFKRNPGIDLADAAYTLQVGRRPFPYRRMCVCSTIEQAEAALTAPDPGMHQPFCPGGEDRDVVFMFSGQGSQYMNMGWDLYQTEPVFREEMDRCFEILTPLMEHDIKEILYPHSDCRGGSPCPPQDYAGSPYPQDYTGSPEQGDHSPLERGTPDPRKGGGVSIINQTEITQPLLFIFEYALAKLLMKWGIKPYAMIGHSIGEYVAACLSGVFALKDALRLVALRGRLMQKMPPGSMLSVSLPGQALKPLLNEELSLAAVNTPSRSVVSGPHQAIAQLSQQLIQKGNEVQPLLTSHAFHSRMMDPIIESFGEAVKQVKLNKPAVPYISNVTGKWITVTEAVDPGYWAKHLRETVRFTDGVTELLKNENAVFLEIGPGKTLSVFVRQHTNKKPGQLVVNLVRHPKEKVTYGDNCYLLNKIGQLWLYGTNMDGAEFYSTEKRNRVSLPPYPFDHQRYWIDVHSFKTSTGIFPGKNILEKKKDIADWFYISSWKRSGLAAYNIKETPAFNHCLIFIDECGIGSQLAEQLKNKGKNILIVQAGKRFTRQDEFLYIINPGESNDYHSLFQDLKTANRVPDLIIHLWGLTGEEVDIPDPKRISRAQDYGFYSQLYISRATRKLNLVNHFNILVVSNHIQEVTGEEILCPGKSTVLGPVKVIPQEFPNISYHSIDVVLPVPGSQQEKKLIKQLVSEVLAKSSDPVIAFRNNYRWVQTFEPVRLEEKIQSKPILREKGVYLITGGLGNIGLVLAKFLAKSVQAKLVLTGRSGFPTRSNWDQWLSKHDEQDTISDKMRKLLQIEALGSQIMVISADAADPPGMKEAVLQAEKRFGQINGVIHAAGVLNEKSTNCPVELVSKNQCETQFHPKIYGLLQLEKLFKDKPLDFCLLASSLSAVLGGLGYTAYAAANIFMNAFAREKNRNGSFRWISVNWDSWKLNEVENQDSCKQADSNDAILPEEGEKTFQRILSWQGENQVVVSIKDLKVRLQQWIELESLKEDDTSGKKPAGPVKSRPGLSTGFTAPRTSLERSIARIWERFFGIENPGIRDDFFELGGDSLKMMTIVSKIHKELDVQIPLSEFFDKPTIAGLADYININSSKKSCRFIPLGSVEKKTCYSLSSAQMRLYVIQQMDENSPGYNLTEAVLIEGNIEKEKLDQSFRQLIKRHEALRTSIQVVENEPVQRIHDEVEFALEYYEAGDSEVKEILRGFVRPFDLSTPPFFRTGLIKIAEDKRVLVLDIHHLITDGIATGIFIDDLMAFYRGKELPSLRFQYKDYSEWQNSEEIQKGLKSQEAYWLKQFKEEAPVLDLPTDFPRPEKKDYEGDVINYGLGNELSKKLDKLAKETGTTIHMILLSVYYIVLSKYSRQEDIVVGSPITGRRHSDLQNILGVFVNVLAMRNRPSSHKRYREFLLEVKENVIKAYENQDYPFDKLVMKLGRQGSPNRNPLFDTVLQMGFDDIELDKSDPQDNSLKITPYPLENKQSVFDIVLFAAESDQGIKLSLRYSTTLFKRSRCEKMIKHYIEILNQAAHHGDIKLKDLHISHELLRVKSKKYQDVQSDFGF